jgi:hypothetical protein
MPSWPIGDYHADWVQGIGEPGNDHNSGIVTVQGVVGGIGQPVDTELPAATALIDAQGNPTTPMIGAALMDYDERSATWQRRRGPTAVALLALGARTTNAFIGATKYSGIGVIIGIEITALTGGGTITMQVFNRIETGGGTGTIMGDGGVGVPIFQSAALGAVGGYGFMIHPGVTPLANVAAAKLLTKSYYINMVANGISVTYSVEHHEMV